MEFLSNPLTFKYFQPMINEEMFIISITNLLLLGELDMDVSFLLLLVFLIYI